MTKTTTRIWGPAEHLQNDEDIGACPEAALEEGDASVFAAALGAIARAKGMSDGWWVKQCTQARRWPISR